MEPTVRKPEMPWYTRTRENPRAHDPLTVLVFMFDPGRGRSDELAFGEEHLAALERLVVVARRPQRVVKEEKEPALRQDVLDVMRGDVFEPHLPDEFHRHVESERPRSPGREVRIAAEFRCSYVHLLGARMNPIAGAMSFDMCESPARARTSRIRSRSRSVYDR